MFVTKVGLTVVFFFALSALVGGAVGKRLVRLHVSLQIFLAVVFFLANTACKPRHLHVDVLEVAFDFVPLLLLFVASIPRALKLAIDFRNFRDLTFPGHTNGIRYLRISRNLMSRCDIVPFL